MTINLTDIASTRWPLARQFCEASVERPYIVHHFSNKLFFFLNLLFAIYFIIINKFDKNIKINNIGLNPIGFETYLNKLKNN